MTELRIFQVAAFTDGSFGGNPAAVVPLDRWLDESLMQDIAAENNLSETAFFVPTGQDEWHIRWFTPTVEVPLCGHATLASAAVIHQKLGQLSWPIRLQSQSGPLSVDCDGNAYTLDFPVIAPAVSELPKGTANALGCEVQESFLGRDIYLAIVKDEVTVQELRPDYVALGALIEHGITVSAEGSDVDFVSRFFAPAIGIPEDPVTGAAHCVLTPYWAERLGKMQMHARQVSSRIGELECELRADRVLLRGKAVFFLSGTISV